MKVNIILGAEFKKRARHLAKKYHSFIDDLDDFKKSLTDNPFQGTDLGQGVQRCVCPSLLKGRAKAEVPEYLHWSC